MAEFIRPTTTAEQVADELMSRIFAGDFAPGDRIQANALAVELGIARNTCREAIRVLELSGLVHHEPRRGAVIITPTPQSVDDLFDARKRLELAAVAKPADERGLMVLRSAFEKLAAVAHTHKPEQIVPADLGFHGAIVGLLRNDRIDRFYSSLMRELRFYLMVLSVEDREFDTPDALLEEHSRLLHAIESGDVASAIDAVGTHVDFNHERVKEILATRTERRRSDAVSAPSR